MGLAGRLPCLLMAFLLSCAAPQEPVDGGGFLPLIEEDPVGVFERDVLFDAREVFAWQLGREEEARRWQLQGRFDEARRQDNGLRISSLQPPLRLVRQVDLHARDLHVVTATVRGLKEGRVRICWAGPGEKLAHERCKASRSRSPRYAVELLRHPLWSGEIERLRLVLDAKAPSPRVRIESLTGSRFELDEARLPAVLRQAWKVNLQTGPYWETRSAWPAPPGLDIVRSLRVPERGVLRFGYAVEAAFRGAARFRISLRRRGGGGTPERLFDRQLAAPAGAGWQDGRVDLGRFAGEDVELVFATETPGAVDLVHGLPFWAHPEIAGAGAASRPNVLLISVDTLRADHLSLYGYPRPTSPRIDSWARSCGTTFETAVASSPWTIPSHTSLFTGLDALRHGVNHVSRLPGPLVTLAERLRDAGYATAAITGGGYVDAQFGFAQGFDRYLGWRQKSTAEAELETGVERAMGWLEQHGAAPFFLFLHTYEVHSPYRPREPFFSRLRPAGGAVPAQWVSEKNRETGRGEGFVVERQWIWIDDPARLRQGRLLTAAERPLAVEMYDSGIAYTDAQLSRLFERLDALGLSRRTLVVLTSDHGESLGERDLVGHSHLYDTDLRVPLVIALPGCANAGRRVASQVRSIDLVPTLLELLGLPSAEGLDGVSLAPLLAGRGAAPAAAREAWSYAASTNRGVALRIDGRLKYIFNNSLWHPLQGREEILQLSPAAGEVARPPRGGDSLAQLRRRVEQRLRSIPGQLRFRFGNALSSPIEVRISGRLDPTRLKAWRVPEGSLSWWQAGNLGLTVRPGESFEIIVEQADGAALSIEPAAPAAGRFALPPASPARPWTLSWDGGAWRETETPPGEGFTGVTATWSERSLADRAAAEDPSDVDPELRDQLRALGYVD